MYVRLLTWTGARDVKGGLVYLRDVALPFIREQHGYHSLSASLDRSNGTFSILSEWETEADRAATDAALAKTRDEEAEVIGGTLRIEWLEEVAREVVRLPEPGDALMVGPFSTDPATIDDTIEYFKREMAPQIKAAPGFCALRNIVIRATGEGYVGTNFEDRAAMEAQIEPAQARRQAAIGEGIVFGPLSLREYLLSDTR